MENAATMVCLQELIEVRKRSPVAPYLVTVGAVAAAVAVRWLLDPILGESLPLVTLYGAIAISVWIGGSRPAIVAMIAGFLACDYLFIEPRGLFSTPRAAHVVGLIAYLVTSSIIIGFGEALRARALQLSDADARSRAVLDTLVDGVVTIDERGVIQSFSAGAERQFGWSASEAIGQNIGILMPDPYRAEHGAYLTNYLRTGEAKVIGKGREVIGRRKDGSTFPMDLAVSEFRVGGERRFSGIVRDVTERKRAEDALVESEKQLRRALDAGRMGTWSWDLRSNEVVWSSGLEAIHGLAPGTFPGTFDAFTSEIHPDDRKVVAQSIERTLQSRGQHHIEYRIVRADGAVRWVEGQGQLLRDESGAPVRMVGICSDTTERREAEEALRRSAHALEVADRRKDEFLATLGHELRNVLAPVVIGAQLLHDAGSDPDLTEEAATVIHRQVVVLTRLVDDLLDVSRIAEGKIELRRELADLAAILRTAIEIARPAIDEMQHELVVDLPAESVMVEGDVVRLAQVFANLLNNAAKYTEPSGTIHVAASREDGEIVVSVRDTGIGMAPDVLPDVFEMFMQTAAGHARSRGGLGIGLTLVKRLVELHGGSVTAKSEGSGHGSEFAVRLPAPAVAAAAVEDLRQMPHVARAC